jgi:hypothetical protein
MHITGDVWFADFERISVNLWADIRSSTLLRLVSPPLPPLSQDKN